jgi:hypothetical protein
MLYSDKRLMYRGLLRPIHGRNLNPFGPPRKPAQIKRPRRLHGGALSRQLLTYLAGAVSAAVEAAAFALW